VVVLEYRPVSYDASYLPRLKTRSTAPAEAPAVNPSDSSAAAGTTVDAGTSSGDGGSELAETGAGGKQEKEESPLIWDERAYIKYNDRLDVTHWEHSTYLGLLNGIVFNRYTTWVSRYSPYLPSKSNSTAASAGAGTGAGIGKSRGMSRGMSSSSSSSRFSRVEGMEGMEGREGRAGAEAEESEVREDEKEEEGSGVVNGDDFISESIETDVPQAQAAHVIPFSPQSICSSGGGGGGIIGQRGEEACFTTAHNWESFIADTLEQMAGWSVSLHAMLPPRAMELQILTNLQPTVVRADPHSTQHARNKDKGRGRGRDRSMLSSTSAISEQDVYFYFSQLIICMDNYSNEDYVSALASCLPGAVAFVHVPNTQDMYLRLEPRSPFAVHTEYLQVIPPARYPISQGILTADWLLGIGLLLVVAAGGLRAMFKLKLHEAGCWCCARSNSAGEVSERRGSSAAAFSLKQGSTHSLLGGKRGKNIFSKNDSSISSKKNSASGSGGILDGVSLLINSVGRTPPASLRGRLWGGHVVGSGNARTFGGNTYAPASTGGASGTGDSDVDEDRDDEDDDACDTLSIRHIDGHSRQHHSAAAAAAVAADEAGMEVEMVSTEQRGSRRGAGLGVVGRIAITNSTPTILNLPLPSGASASTSPGSSNHKGNGHSSEGTLLGAAGGGVRSSGGGEGGGEFDESVVFAYGEEEDEDGDL